MGRCVRVAPKVLDLEDISPALARRANELGRVDLGEALRSEEAAEAAEA